MEKLIVAEMFKKLPLFVENAFLNATRDWFVTS